MQEAKQNYPTYLSTLAFTTFMTEGQIFSRQDHLRQRPQRPLRVGRHRVRQYAHAGKLNSR